MPIDTSIYGNIQAHQMPNVADSMSKALTLSNLGLQNQQERMNYDNQLSARQAFQDSTGSDGSLNQRQYLSKLGAISPQMMMQQQQALSQMAEQHAKALSAQADAQSKVDDYMMPKLQYLASIKSPDEQSMAYQKILNQAHAEGMPVSGAPTSLDPDWLKSTMGQMQNRKSYLENQLTAANTGKSLAEREKTESETYKRNPDILGQTNDPARLVPGFVPKEHQAKAFGEIDAAENTKKMARSIMDSFDQAAKDTSGVGAVTSLVKDPRSVLALHQSMQPTFKDLEGTVRQAAMDNTFKNVTPSPYDTAKDLATKRQALQDYLQSKISAPTARAYGIDLGKFDRTAPYSAPPRSGGSDGGGSGIPGVSSSYASDMVRIQAPNGKVLLVPPNQVGAAIANGGKKVK